ncbi:CPBP family intramembrane glutamic endopeptidase [Christiangramia sp. SM2212]|uniref:CPBP family intramembrane glutamic endopeptidase n=1 Tax=Christiangramia sediminicola TaxID=3073267 RepID=A0ABU1EP37_9FLAO|nr:CPBP family intramembrane glutamic endopeptidase [Christiangramia sp. SM2212]MDR5589913.1 CPBP family intramembrane glutamic endopeptidase [Christiangramia sp. SM2212]
MIGLLTELLISWILLYFFEKRSILALGFLPLSKRVKQFFLGFLITGIICLVVQLLEASLRNTSWIYNDDFKLLQLWSYFFWDLKSVIFEELIFRGALLFILLQRIKTGTALIISASAFGIYHWFSMGIFGNLIPMLVIFLGTGMMGYAWALAFKKTRSIALPIGLHLGWNFTLNTIFSNGPLGEGLFLLKNEGIISNWFSLVGLLIVPILVLAIVIFFIEDEADLAFH